MEDHGYVVKANGNYDGVYVRVENGEYELVNVISFHLLDRAVTFHIVDKELEPQRKNRLDLSQIYGALADVRNCKAEDVDWVISETANDQPTIKLIAEIRENRKFDQMYEVLIQAGDIGWNEILGTKHFQHAAIVKSGLPDKILIRTIQRVMFGINYKFDTLCFHFSTPETETQDDETSTSTIDKQTENSRGNRVEEWKETWNPEWEADEEEAAALIALLADIGK
ncbi:hypothetical protein HOO65_090225 [Ceratocystis lukuohia]|uniref:Uncharacterized protein n=1 Tax=Ceratocystis lukuohia TaxID=2019550 RepID=A0ABR4M9H4_9PEZI